MLNKKPYIVVVEDTIVVLREYVTLATDEKEAKDNILNGEFVVESEGTVIDNVNADIKNVERLT